MKYVYPIRGLVPDGVRAALDDRYGPNGWTQDWSVRGFLRDKDDPEWMATQSLINQGVIPKPELTKQAVTGYISFKVFNTPGDGVGNFAAMNRLVFK